VELKCPQKFNCGYELKNENKKVLKYLKVDFYNLFFRKFYGTFLVKISF
jgi:hypothetical protein